MWWVVMIRNNRGKIKIIIKGNEACEYDEDVRRKNKIEGEKVKTEQNKQWQTISIYKRDHTQGGRKELDWKIKRKLTKQITRIELQVRER